MQELWDTKQKIVNKEAEFILVFSRLKKAAAKLKDAEETLKKCEKNL